MDFRTKDRTTTTRRNLPLCSYLSLPSLPRGQETEHHKPINESDKSPLCFVNIDLLAFPEIFGTRPTRALRTCSAWKGRKVAGVFFAPKPTSYCRWVICSSVNKAVFSRKTTTGKEQGMELSDNDIQRIVDRLRPTLSQILQNQSGNQSLVVSKWMHKDSTILPGASSS